MYSSEYLERFYFQYQSEACLMENLSNRFVLAKPEISYNIFQKWF